MKRPLVFLALTLSAATVAGGQSPADTIRRLDSLWGAYVSDARHGVGAEAV